MELSNYFRGERSRLKFVTDALELLKDERRRLDSVIATLERLERRRFPQSARKRGLKSVPVGPPKQRKNEKQ